MKWDETFDGDVDNEESLAIGKRTPLVICFFLNTKKKLAKKVKLSYRLIIGVLPLANEIYVCSKLRSAGCCLTILGMPLSLAVNSLSCDFSLSLKKSRCLESPCSPTIFEVHLIHYLLRWSVIGTPKHGGYLRKRLLVTLEQIASDGLDPDVKQDDEFLVTFLKG